MKSIFSISTIAISKKYWSWNDTLAWFFERFDLVGGVRPGEESKVSLYNNGQGININLSGDILIITSQHTGGVQRALSATITINYEISNSGNKS